MKDIAIWHCYWYGPHEAYVFVAETEDALRTKVRGAIAEYFNAMGWYPEDDGPMPEDWDALMEKYQEVSSYHCYFGDWGYTIIDSTLCTPVEDEE